LLDPEYEDTKYLRNIDDCLPADKVLEDFNIQLMFLGKKK